MPSQNGETNDAVEDEKNVEPKHILGKMMPKMPNMPFKTGSEPEAPNALWEHIEAKDWEEVSKDLDGEGAASMAKEWHQGLLPLHVVCKNAEVPDEVVVKLVDIYPEAVKERGKNRMLPLQMAVQAKGSYQVIRMLIRTFPDALDARVDDNNPLAFETTRTWTNLKGHSADVKKMLNRSTADWRVIIQYESEQREQHNKLISLEKKLKTAKKKQDATDEANKSLNQRVEELEAAHSDFKTIIVDVVDEKERNLEAMINELKKSMELFMESQEVKNKEFREEIVAANSRVANTKAVFNGYTGDMMTLYQQNKRATEELKKEISDLKPEAG